MVLLVLCNGQILIGKGFMGRGWIDMEVQHQLVVKVLVLRWHPDETLSVSSHSPSPSPSLPPLLSLLSTLVEPFPPVRLQLSVLKRGMGGANLLPNIFATFLVDPVDCSCHL